MFRYIWLITGIFLILGIYMSSTAHAETVLIMECRAPNRGNSTILSHIEHRYTEAMVDNKWTASNMAYYSIVAFGVKFSDTNSMCQPFEMRVETATLTKTKRYVDRDECLEGIYGDGNWQITVNNFVTTANTINTYNNTNNTCRINAVYIGYGKEWSLITTVDSNASFARRSCTLAKQHYHRSITDSTYCKDFASINRQNDRCKEITIAEFERKSSVNIRELLKKFNPDNL